MSLPKSSDQPDRLISRTGSQALETTNHSTCKETSDALAWLPVLRMGAFVLVLAVGASWPGDAGAVEAEGLNSRAEIYVDQYFPPEPGLDLQARGRLKGVALAHYSRAVAFEQQKNLDGALRELSEVLRLMPENVDLALRVAHLLAATGQKKEGRTVLEQALQIQPQSYQALIGFSDYLWTYHAENHLDRERALALAEEALEKFPDEAVVYDHLIRLYLIGRQVEKAKSAINTALQRSSPDPFFWLEIARIAQGVWPLKTSEGQEPVLLNNIYQKVLDHSKNQVEVQEAVAGFYHSSYQPEKARVLYEKIIAEHPDRQEVRKSLAAVYQALGLEDKMIETLGKILQIDPRDVDTNKLLAEIYRQRKDPTNAAHFLQQALKISKGSESEYIYLAEMLLTAGHPEDAVLALERAAYYYPEEPGIVFLLAISRTGAKQYEAALDAFEQTIQLGKEARPDLLNERFYFQYGAAAERAGHLDQAADLFRKSMELLAKSGAEDGESKAFTAQVYNYLGYMWLENDLNIDEAGELIKTAFNLTPDSGAIRDSLGWYYFKKKQFEEARRELTESMALMEEPDPVVHDHLAQTYFQLGMKPEALDHIKKALELDAGNQEFVERLKKFEAGEPPVPRPLPESVPKPEEKGKDQPQPTPAAGKKAA
jgi:tetratricopeptide (TPR) repeat protein